MKAVAYLALLLTTPAFSEPAYYEAFDFKKCLHWGITNEMHGDDLAKEPKQYVAALELANRQPYSRHKTMSAEQLEQIERDHPYEMVVVYSADAYDQKSKKHIDRYGVCKSSRPTGIACLPNQDFPLAGASYNEIRSKGPLVTLACVSGCTGTPATIHYMGYENMEGETNVEREEALKTYSKKCGRAP